MNISLFIAREQLVELKVQLHKVQKKYLEMGAANPSANTVTLLATISTLNSQIKKHCPTLSPFATNTRVATCEKLYCTRGRGIGGRYVLPPAQRSNE